MSASAVSSHAASQPLRAVRPWWQAAPFTAVFVLFFLIPLALIVMVSFWRATDYELIPAFTLQSYLDLFGEVTLRTYVSTIRNTLYYRGEQITTSFRAGYTTKVFHVPTRFALNVENVFDDRDPIVSTFDGGYRDTNGIAIANGFILRAPRTTKLSARFTF